MNLPTDTTPTFYDPQSGRVQTFAACTSMEDYDPEGTPIAYVEGTGKEYLEKEPHLLLIPFFEALKLSEEADAKRYEAGKGKEITEKDYWYFLEVLPPQNWVNYSTEESFRMSEDLAGSLSNFYVRLHDGIFPNHKDRYFSIVENKFKTHKELIKIIKKQFNIKN